MANEKIKDDWATQAAGRMWTHEDTRQEEMSVPLAGHIAEALRAERARWRGRVQALLDLAKEVLGAIDNGAPEDDAALLRRVVCEEHGKPSYRTCGSGHCMLVVR